MSAGMLSWAFAAGSVAALNPCGFAVLPAYLAFLLGREEPGPVAAALARGVARGLVMTVGVVTLFTVVGWAMGAVRAILIPILPWLAVLVGVALVVLGGAQLLRRSLAVELAAASRLAPGGSRERTWASTYLFGVGYGLASLGCTLPIFLALAAQSLATRSLQEALAVFLAYGVGMGWVLVLASVAVGVGNTVVVRGLRRGMGWVRTAGAVGMMAAGGYLVYFYRGAFGGGP
jgi:cytochrome c-type biogenesis protein